MICVPCRRIYRPLRNGIYFEEMRPVGNTRATQGWEPYKLWVADQLKCPGCGHEVLAGIPNEPIAEHYHPEYDAMVRRYEPEMQLDDCGVLQIGYAPLVPPNDELMENAVNVLERILDFPGSTPKARTAARTILAVLSFRR